MEAFIYGWYPDYIDPDDYTYPIVHSSGGSWLNLDYANPHIDQLIEWARGNTSSASRDDLYCQIQDLIVEDSLVIPLYQGVSDATTQLDVSAVNLDITGFIRYSYVIPEFWSPIALSAFIVVLLVAVIVGKPRARFDRRARH